MDHGVAVFHEFCLNTRNSFKPWDRPPLLGEMSGASTTVGMLMPTDGRGWANCGRGYVSWGTWPCQLWGMVMPIGQWA